MKTKKIFSASLFLAFAIVLVSCSSSVEIAKRTFNNGYYVHVTKNKRVVEKNETASVIVPAKSPQISKNESNSREIVVAYSENTIVPSKAERNDGNTEVASLNKTPLLSSEKKFSFAIASAELSSVNDNLGSGPKEHFSSPGELRKLVRHSLFRGSDIPAIVLVLLCFFLPFIAVGIVDDWGNRFLIDLLLCLLFYLPGIIYAFIVCFG